ncbi:hypothetical protein SteCoe_38063 [Stentor coeruleus]|uniref:Uncharacterized protein n=1 Tax=Stentor coeruleus TaxID=5963 RepID=A0A1R2ALW2_9CILI|nr:hypothetical protein SteCoe_38063 [Stentor coeruleus]
MTEAGIIELLSNVSDDFLSNSTFSFPLFETDLSAWKNISSTYPVAKSIPEPVRIRIRTVESRRPLTINSSSTHSSSNNSRCTSPKLDKIWKIKAKESKKVVCITMSQNLSDELETSVETLPQKTIRVCRPNGPKRKRKPIKIFRLPKVMQGSDNE